jgi:hypothetical protein
VEAHPADVDGLAHGPEKRTRNTVRTRPERTTTTTLVAFRHSAPSTDTGLTTDNTGSNRVQGAPLIPSELSMMEDEVDGLEADASLGGTLEGVVGPIE